MPPLFMKSISLTLQAAGELAPVEFNCNVRIATIEAAAGDVVTFEPLCEDGAYSESGPTSYALHLVGAQDWGTASNGLARYLDDHESATAAFEFQAHGAAVTPSDEQPAKGGSCVLVAPNYGGEKTTYAEFDVTLPIVGKPELITTLSALLAAAREPAAEDAEAVA
jgi:hypothetical protein